MSERVEYGVLDLEGRLTNPLGIAYPTLREAEERWAWMESLVPMSGPAEPRGPYTIVQRTRVVKVSEWEPVGDGSTK